jgi:hypothetical protein
MTEHGVPTLHSDNYKYKGPSPKEEVLLAAMDETNISQAAPMLCIFKKDSVKLHTIINRCKCNDNMEKDVTPFPDQEQIRHDVAQAKYQSKIDMSNAYEQIRVEPKDVWKTVFATIYGTFVSHTMQQGDCNAPAKFQRLMTVIF